jgi:hypothetical protein
MVGVKGWLNRSGEIWISAAALPVSHCQDWMIRTSQRLQILTWVSQLGEKQSQGN